MTPERVFWILVIIGVISIFAWAFIDGAINTDVEKRELCTKEVQEMVASNFDNAVVDCNLYIWGEAYSVKDWKCNIKNIDPETNEITKQEGIYHYPCSWNKNKEEGVT